MGAKTGAQLLLAACAALLLLLGFLEHIAPTPQTPSHEMRPVGRTATARLSVSRQGTTAVDQGSPAPPPRGEAGKRRTAAKRAAQTPRPNAAQTTSKARNSSRRQTPGGAGPTSPEREVIMVLFTGEGADLSDSLFRREALGLYNPDSRYEYRYAQVDGNVDSPEVLRRVACETYPGKKIWVMRDTHPKQGLIGKFPRSTSVLVYLHDEFCLLGNRRSYVQRLRKAERHPELLAAVKADAAHVKYSATLPLFKQYYCRLQWDNFGTGNIRFMPLGPRQDFRVPDPTSILPPTKRKYLYVLAVSPTSEVRTEAYAYFSKSTAVDPDKRFLFMAEKWSRSLPKTSNSAALSAADFARLLRDSTFVLCPRGHSIEQFRIYEALESGAIPVIGPDGEYLREHLPPELFDSPLVIGKSWQDMEKQMVALASNPKQLQRRWEKVQRWYKGYMASVVQKMEQTLEQREPDGYCD